MYSIGLLFSVMGVRVLYSRAQGVISVRVDFVGETLSRFVWNHCSSVCLYSSRCVTAVSGLVCCEKMVMSSA